MLKTRKSKRLWHIRRVPKYFLGPDKRGVVRMSLEHQVEGSGENEPGVSGRGEW